MQITISTPLPRLGYELAADLETRGFTGATVVTADAEAYELRHGRAVPPGDIGRLLDMLKPLQPEAILSDDTLAEDAVVLQLADSVPLDAWEVRLLTDSPSLQERCRDMLDTLGFRDCGKELGLQDKNQLIYGGASPFARHVIRWQLRRLGLKVDEQRQEDWADDDDDILLTLSDPALLTVPPAERFTIDISTDDYAAGELLRERLQSAGFRCLPLTLLEESKALEQHINIDPGPFGGDRAPGDLARLRVLVADLLRDQQIDISRYSLKVNGDSRGLSAAISLPLAACKSGQKLPYDGPFPERFNLKIHTDAPAALAGLKQAMVLAGFRTPEVEQCSSLLDDDFEAGGSGIEKGFFLVWGAAGKQEVVARQLQDLVQAEMTGQGAWPTFNLNISDRFGADDPDVWIYFPVRGVADGSLLEKLCDPGRFKLKVYCPDPGEWSDLIGNLEGWGFATCEAVTRPSGRPAIDYGAAPSALIDSLRERVRELSTLNAAPRKAWNDSDEDIWIYLPARPRRPETRVDAPGEPSLDLDSWLPPVTPERVPFLDATAERLRIGHVTLPRRQGPVDHLVPDLRSFTHFCLDARTCETLLHLATGVALREPCLLEGETSTSKTSSILYLAALLNQPVVRINLNGQTDTGELVGRFVPSAMDSESDGAPASPAEAASFHGAGHAAVPHGAQPFWRWQDGLVVQAMKNGWWVLLDEVNLAEPQILERLNSVLEHEPSLVLTENDNSFLGPAGTPVHAGFRIFATMNPAEYVGRSVLSPAYRDRWRGYRFVPRPGENEYLLMLRFLVFGAQPDVAVLGQPYAGVSPALPPPYTGLADWPVLADLLPALARFHAALERAAGQSEEDAGRMGARRKERYVFTRRGLLSILQYLASPLVSGAGQPGSPRLIREAILRYYLGRVSSQEDQGLVVQLLDAAGLGPNTWSLAP